MGACIGKPRPAKSAKSAKSVNSAKSGAKATENDEEKKRAKLAGVVAWMESQRKDDTNLFRACEEALRQALGEARCQQIDAKDVDIIPALTFTAPLYPMYVMSKECFLSLSCSGPGAGVPRHEEAMARGLLCDVVEYLPGQYVVFKVLPDGKRGEVVISSGFLYNHRAQFLTVSHQWLRPNRDPARAHPDSETHSKLSTLQLWLKHPKEEESFPADHLLFIWMDWMSIPQDPARRKEQEHAIMSLPCYFLTSTTTVIITQKGGFWDLEKGYLSRGHCLLELMTSKLPRTDIFGLFYMPGYAWTGEWGATLLLEVGDRDQTGKARELKWADLSKTKSPIDGNFTIDADRPLMLPLVKLYLKAFHAFDGLLSQLRDAESWDAYDTMHGSKAWVQTMTHDKKGSTPKEFADALLPASCVDMMQDSVRRFEAR